MKELEPIQQFFTRRGWTPFPFQVEAWEASLRGESGLIHVPTGSGKTYAAVMGPLARLLASPRKRRTLRILYLTPLRALARDLELALKEPVRQEGWKIKIESRTGDTSAAVRRRQLQSPADVLLTTPESLSIMISQEDGEDLLKNIECVILDEWHELLSSKRGTMTELALAYLRHLNPEMQTWALSASIGNLEEAARLAVGPGLQARVISGAPERELDLECLWPDRIDRFPWAGHLGLPMAEKLLRRLDPEESTLIFTNTRFQAEKWFETLRSRKPEMEGLIAIHHSSLDREERELVEEGVKSGDIKWVVCTSSLDLGVDFQPVERCVQIGSPKMVARLLQRAGRSAHRPGAKSRLLFVPTHAWEILELEAVKSALRENDIESRRPLAKPVDVLLQHMMTLACGPGLRMDELWEQLQGTHSYRGLSRAELNWCLRFLTQGGDTLQAYPQFHKLVYEEESARFRPAHAKLARIHRMSIGTITSREMMNVVTVQRSRLGAVEENFISGLKKGDVFQFAGRRLELVMIKDMMAYVKPSRQPTNTIPIWGGGRLPLSEILSRFLREVIGSSRRGGESRLQPLLAAQRDLSELPDEDSLLIEVMSSGEGEHLFVYPFEGRLVHEGLAHLWATRFASRRASTFAFSVNDYGFEILAPAGYGFEDLFDDDFLSTDRLEADIGLSLQLGELTKRQFRDVAQIAGLTFSGYPGAAKTRQQRQISSSLLYEVFERHEPGHLLLRQARDEVLSGSLESGRLKAALERLANQRQVWKTLEQPSPLAFPLLIERVASRVSNESLEAKVERLKRAWEKQARIVDDHPPP